MEKAQNPEEVILQSFQYSLKLEDTTNGVRIVVHAYGNNKNKIVEDATEIYMSQRRRKELVFAPFK